MDRSIRIVGLAFLLVLLAIVILLLTFLITETSTITGIKDGSIIGGIVGCFGSIIGGALTLVGVSQTLKYQYNREFVNAYPEKFMLADEIVSLLENTSKLLRRHEHNLDFHEIITETDKVSQLYDEIITKSAKINDVSFLVAKAFMIEINGLNTFINGIEERMIRLDGVRSIRQIDGLGTVEERESIDNEIREVESFRGSRIKQSIDKLEILYSRYQAEVKDKLTKEYRKIKHSTDES